MNKKAIGIVAVCIFLVGTILGAAGGYSFKERKVEKIIEVQIERACEEVVGDLNEWQILEMAIMKTESEFDPSCLGASNDVGILQCTPVWVEEVNRILRMEEGNEREYSHLDAFDIQKSIEMFNVVQDYHNKEKSIGKAINVQNPGGASIGYGKKVYQNIAFIKKYETARKELIKYQLKHTE